MGRAGDSAQIKTPRSFSRWAPLQLSVVEIPSYETAPRKRSIAVAKRTKDNKNVIVAVWYSVGSVSEQ